MSEDQLQAMLDLQGMLEREAIRELKARYLRLADAHEWDAWREVFTDDLHVEFMDGAPFEGADNFVAFIRDLNKDLYTVHHGHNSELTLDGPTDAHGTWAFADYTEQPPHPKTGERISVTRYGRYYETYRKVDGAWKIASMRLTYRAVAPPRPTSKRQVAEARG
jgi:SnoaL-like domain